MLVYTHRCQGCGAEFTKKEAFFYKPVKRCPECTGIVQRIPQNPVIVFKDFTWYSTNRVTGAERNDRAGRLTGRQSKG